MSTDTSAPIAVSRGWRTKWVDRASSRLSGLPPASGGYSVTRGVRVPMRDGIELIADHYAPSTAASGTVLVRSPYGRGGLFALPLARAYAERGYHVLLQSCRGTFGSGDAFRPMVAEIDDAKDTVAWLREQAWFDGQLATLGPSYLGFTQWALLMDPPPELAAAIVIVGPHDFSRAVYGTGAFTLSDFLGWSEMITRQEEIGVVRGVARMLTASRRLAPGLNGLPLADSGDALMHGHAPWYREWLAHPDGADAFWDRMRLHAALDRVQVPVLLIGGWQDIFLDQTLEQYGHLRARGIDVSLVVGPWTHLAASGGQTTRAALEWLGEHVAGNAGTAPGRRAHPVRIRVTGADEWRDLADWPPATEQRVLYLHPAGRLDASQPAPDAPPSAFTYDPADPTPTVGGRLLSPQAGVRSNRRLEERGDVLTFTGPVLDVDLEVVGNPVVELAHRSDNPHADVFVRLCEVDRKGHSRNVCDGMIRLDPDAAPGEVISLTMDAMAHRFRAGSRLRLQVSGGSHPRFARNLGTADPLATGTAMVPSHRTIAHGEGGNSRIFLPATTPTAASGSAR